MVFNSEFKALRDDFTPDFENDNRKDSSIVLLQEKYPTSTMDDFRYQNKDIQIEAKTIEPNQETYECYYCIKFQLITNQKEYENHVILDHPNKLAYPSLADLNKNNISPKGKKWEI